ncbi:MAG: ATP-binding protein [Anaerolineales bacterium]|nr:ATP-binding protein [Anaerolineales bacterium]MCX7609412.1 ATP-binding protein [Anaerolineales bacterium]MDW8227119.1 ATP-binding protein [Anaerolineales bacterium]
MTTARAPSKILPRAFPGITPDEVADLIANSELKNYPADVVLCRENAIEDTFYIILQGEVEVTKTINDSEQRLLKVLGAGEFFGEMALIHNAPRAATVRTLTPLIALEIRRDAFHRVLRRSSSISLAMVREISRRLRENDEMAIDDLRLRARELAEAYQKMAEMEAAKREFITNISHQLRTPLTSVNGYLQMLLKGAIPEEKKTEALETVTRNVEQIVKLVNDMLFIQETELILDQFEAVNLVNLARTVAARYYDRAREAGVHLQIKPNLFVPPVAGDAKNLERAITALVDNAIKFSPSGGRVQIRIYRKGDQVLLEVQDQGIGIQPEKLPHIFDRFYHLDHANGRLFEGIGIGLAIARQVIQQHRGQLTVESTPGKGSTFTIALNIWNGQGNDTEVNSTL